MEANRYSDKEVEEVVKAFKVFIKKVVKHSAIDYARKLKSNSYRDIVYSDLVDTKMSLSVFDDDIFFHEEKVNYKKLENIVHKESHRKAITILTEREKQVLYLCSQGYPDIEIAKEMKTSANCIRVTKSNAKNKVLRKVEELENE